MKTVNDFFDMVMCNEFHRIRLKDYGTDKVIVYFDSVEGLEKSGCGNREIKNFATDWNERVYILWV